MHKSLPIILIVSILLSSSASALDGLPPESTALRVAVDWSRVSPIVVRRCGFEGFGSLLLQYLLEAGYAVIEQSESPTDARIQISEEEQVFRVRVRLGGLTRQRSVSFGQKCGSSRQFELIRMAISELEALVAHLTRANAKRIAKETPDHTVEEDVHTQGDPQRLAESPHRVWSFEVEATVLIPGSGFLLPRVGSGISILFGDFVALGLLLELTGMLYGQIEVFEPGVSARLMFLVELGRVMIRIGGEATGVVHIASGWGRTNNHLDARFGLPLELGWDGLGLGAVVAPHVRLFEVRHRVDGRSAFFADIWGVSVGLVGRWGL